MGKLKHKIDCLSRESIEQKEADSDIEGQMDIYDFPQCVPKKTTDITK